MNKPVMSSNASRTPIIHGPRRRRDVSPSDFLRLQNENAYLRGRLVEKEDYEEGLEMDLNAARALAKRLVDRVNEKDHLLFKAEQAVEQQNEQVRKIGNLLNVNEREAKNSIVSKLHDRIEGLVKNLEETKAECARKFMLMARRVDCVAGAHLDLLESDSGSDGECGKDYLVSDLDESMASLRVDDSEASVIAVKKEATTVGELPKIVIKQEPLECQSNEILEPVEGVQPPKAITVKQEPEWDNDYLDIKTESHDEVAEKVVEKSTDTLAEAFVKQEFENVTETVGAEKFAGDEIARQLEELQIKRQDSSTQTSGDSSPLVENENDTVSGARDAWLANQVVKNQNKSKKFEEMCKEKTQQLERTKEDMKRLQVEYNTAFAKNVELMKLLDRTEMESRGTCEVLKQLEKSELNLAKLQVKYDGLVEKLEKKNNQLAKAARAEEAMEKLQDRYDRLFLDKVALRRKLETAPQGKMPLSGKGVSGKENLGGMYGSSDELQNVLKENGCLIVSNEKLKSENAELRAQLEEKMKLLDENMHSLARAKKGQREKRKLLKDSDRDMEALINKIEILTADKERLSAQLSEAELKLSRSPSESCQDVPSHVSEITGERDRLLKVKGQLADDISKYKNAQMKLREELAVKSKLVGEKTTLLKEKEKALIDIEKELSESKVEISLKTQVIQRTANCLVETREKLALTQAEVDRLSGKVDFVTSKAVKNAADLAAFQVANIPMPPCSRH